MSLKSTAQYFEVVESPSSSNVIMLEPEHLEESIDVSELPVIVTEMQEPLEIEIFVEELPGAPAGTKDPEPEIEVEEEKEEVKEDENDAVSKKNEKWNWSAHGAEGFVAWVKERIESVPKHSGQDTAGLERAVSYLEKLDTEISKAMRMDLDGELDANQIEKVRADIDDGIERLHDRLNKVRDAKKKKKKRADFSPIFVKEAQKSPGVGGVYITVPLLISRIARVCINGTVSAGHDIADLFKRQAEKYKLNDRERAETMQLLADMGYPLRQDRGYLDDEEVDPSSSDNFDWAANYQG